MNTKYYRSCKWLIEKLKNKDNMTFEDINKEWLKVLSPDCIIDDMSAAIMDYVGRIKPVIVEDYQPKYEEIWLRILELEEVKKDIYDRGRQQGTIFNRSLVANIIHLMAIDNMVVKGTNDVRIAELLEPSKGKNHPVRSCLGLSPESRVKRAIEQLLIELGVKVCES